MNNKKLGTAFENRLCEVLDSLGFWVHFITPDKRGSQPFDIIAVKNGEATAIDCKTCSTERISINRLEDNQIMAFEKWLRCGNQMPLIAVEYSKTKRIYLVPYNILRANKSVKFTEMRAFA